MKQLSANNDILISIIIPTYNTLNYIEECVEAFEKQNYNDFEIIICDDASSDGTVELLGELKKKYDNITICLNKHRGSGYERNKGIELAKGQYVFFCDSDDYVANVFFQVLSSEIMKDSPDILFFNYNEIIDGEVYRTIKTDISQDKYDFFYRNSCVWSSIYKRSLFIDNNIYFPDDLYHQDDAIYFKLIEKAEVVRNIDSILYNYRKFRPSSSMNSKSERYYNDILIVAEMNLEYFSRQASEKGFKCICDIYAGKLFDYLLFNLAYSGISVANNYYYQTIDILNKYVKHWQKNNYFYDQKVSLITRITRKTLRYKFFFKCYNTKILKSLFKKKMRNYQ